MIEEHNTSAPAREVQRAAFRRLPSAERVALAFEMSEEVRRLAADGLRHRLPKATATEIEKAVRRLMLGEELADCVDQSR